MDEEIEIINTNTRVEKLKNFFFRVSKYQDFIYFKGLIPFHDT